jgi:hypothetical protein
MLELDLGMKDVLIDDKINLFPVSRLRPFWIAANVHEKNRVLQLVLYGVQVLLKRDVRIAHETVVWKNAVIDTGLQGFIADENIDVVPILLDRLDI